MKYASVESRFIDLASMLVGATNPINGNVYPRQPLFHMPAIIHALAGETDKIKEVGRATPAVLAILPHAIHLASVLHTPNTTSLRDIQIDLESIRETLKKENV